MQLTVEHMPIETGFFRKRTYWDVRISVCFDSQELLTIKCCRMEDVLVMQRPWDARPYRAVEGSPVPHRNLTIGELLKKPDTYRWMYPGDAKNYEERVKQAMVTLKNILDWNSSPPSGRLTYHVGQSE